MTDSAAHQAVPQTTGAHVDARPGDAVWPAASWPPPVDTVLTGEHVELRRASPDDTFDLFIALDEPRAWMHIPTEQPYKVHVMGELIASGLANPSRFPWVVRARETEEIVGWTSFVETSERDARTEIGSTQFSPAVWGTAVNPESKLLLLGYAFDVLRMGRVQLKTDVRNLRSQAAIVKLGATFEGVLRRYQRRADGTVRDSVLYSVTAEEWPRVRDGLRERLASTEESA